MVKPLREYTSCIVSSHVLGYTNQAVQPQKMDRGLKFQILILYYIFSENKGTDQRQLRTAPWFSHNIMQKAGFLMTRVK